MATRRLSLGQIFRDAISHLFNLDSKLGRTVLGLTRDPGRVCREYIDGKRVRYVPPLRFFLVALATVLLANLVIGFDANQVSTGTDLSPHQEAARVAVATYIAKHLDLVLLLVLPFFTAVICILFKKSGLNYAEVSVLVLFLLGFMNLLGFFLAPVKLLSPWVAIVIRFSIQTALFTWASVVFFQVSKTSSLLKNLVATAAYFILIFISVTVLSLPKLLPAIQAASESQ